MFDGSYNQLVFSAGSPFIRRALAYPHTNSEPPPQTSSILPHGIRIATSMLIHISGLPQAYTMLREAFLFLQRDFNLDFDYKIK